MIEALHDALGEWIVGWRAPTPARHIRTPGYALSALFCVGLCGDGHRIDGYMAPWPQNGLDGPCLFGYSLSGDQGATPPFSSSHTEQHHAPRSSCLWADGSGIPGRLCFRVIGRECGSLGRRRWGTLRCHPLKSLPRRSALRCGCLARASTSNAAVVFRGTALRGIAARSSPPSLPYPSLSVALAGFRWPPRDVVCQRSCRRCAPLPIEQRHPLTGVVSWPSCGSSSAS